MQPAEWDCAGEVRAAMPTFMCVCVCMSASQKVCVLLIAVAVAAGATADVEAASVAAVAHADAAAATATAAAMQNEREQEKYTGNARMWLNLLSSAVVVFFLPLSVRVQVCPQARHIVNESWF